MNMWITDEVPPRVLFVKGVSGLDPDVLVAFEENHKPDQRCFWLINNGHLTENVFVCGAGEGARARKISLDQHGCEPKGDRE